MILLVLYRKDIRNSTKIKLHLQDTKYMNRDF